MRKKTEQEPKFVQVQEQAPTDVLSSVEIAQNSKGVNVAVKVRDKDPYKAAQDARKIFDNLRETYGAL